MESLLDQAIRWIGPHAVLLALVLPVVIRIVGHWLPEELFMVAVGVLAARRPPGEAAVLLAAAWTGHFVTDQAVFTVGRWLSRRLDRHEAVRRRIDPARRRLLESPRAAWGLVPARVLPVGRGAWLLAAGAVGLPRLRFAAVDAVALTVHTVVWCGLGWLAQDGAAAAAEAGMAASAWVAAAVVLAALSVAAWRRRPERLRALRGPARPADVSVRPAEGLEPGAPGPRG